MTSVHDRIDPEVAEGLEGYFKLVGPGGLGAISDLGERRARLSAVMAMAGAAAGPSDDIETSDHLVPGPAGAPEVPIRVYRPKGADGPLPGILDIHGGGMTTRHRDGRLPRHRPRREQRLRRRLGRIPAGA
jgi:acetyl esterase/lipase